MPRVKKMKVVFTFPSTVQALTMEQCCKRDGLDGRLIPVPKQISAGCGMAWAAVPDSKAALEIMISQEGIEVEGTYELLL